ncbi:MAG: DUF3187 family protein [candidate division Zixibacteria bacterium]|nr:DUF3187 family protein [candidate division Zixibacteria bacterium]
MNVAVIAEKENRGDDVLPGGFIELPSQAPVQQILFGLPHQTPWAAPARSCGLALQQTWTNLWLYQEGRYRIDAEVMQYRLTARAGLGKGIDVSAAVPVRYISGGILDGFVEAIHRGLGSGDASRDEFARDDYSFYVNSTGMRGDWTGDEGRLRGWTLGSVVLSTRVATPVFGRHMRGAVSLHAKLPTSLEDSYTGRQGIDVGVSASMMRSLGPIHAYVSAGAAYYGDRSLLGVPLAPWHFSLLWAVERHVPGSRHGWVTQMTIESKSADDFSQLSKNTFEVLTGYRYHVSDRTRVELGVAENLFYFDNTPDISFHLALSHDFGAR